jgi:hypothetical protein
MIRKVSPHITQNEPLLFEVSSPGKRAYQLPALTCPPSIRLEFWARRTFATKSRVPRSK